MTAALTLLLVGQGCTSDLSGLYNRQVSISTERFGNDDRLRATVTPGVIVEADESRASENVWLVGAHASAPYPTVTLDNGTIDNSVILVILENADINAVARGTLRPLSDDARSDPNCEDIVAQEEDLLFADTGDLLPDEDDALVVGAIIPPCSTVELVTELPRTRETYQLAIFGSANGRLDYLFSALEAAEFWGADSVHFLGNVGVGGASSNEDSAATFSVFPFTYSVSPGVDDHDGGMAAFQDVFGQTDFAYRIGVVPVMVLDMGRGFLSDAQLRFISESASNPGEGLVLTSLPLFDADGVQNEGGRNVLQAAGAMDSLIDRGYDYFISSPGRAENERDMGSARLIETGGDYGDAGFWLQVTITRPWPDLVRCEASIDCESGERCASGFCRVRCTDDSECPDSASLCEPRTRTCRRPCDSSEDCLDPVPECGALGYCLDTPIVGIERARIR